MKKGFTLIEIMAIIIILAVLMIFAIPSVLNTLEESRKKTFEIQSQMIWKTAKEEHYLDQMLFNTLDECYDKNNLSIDSLSSDISFKVIMSSSGEPSYLEAVDLNNKLYVNSNEYENIKVIKKEDVDVLFCDLDFKRIVEKIWDAAKEKFDEDVEDAGAKTCYDLSSLEVNDIDSTVSFAVNFNVNGDVSSIHVVETKLKYDASASKRDDIIVKYNKNVSHVSCGDVGLIDFDNPTLEVKTTTLNPINGQWHNEVIINASATDATSGVKGIKYCKTTDDICVPDEIKLNSSLNISLTSALLEQKVCFQSYDNANNSSEVKCSEKYYVDNEKPTISTVKVTGVTSNTASVTVTASDLFSNGLTYYYSIDGKSYTSSSLNTYTFTNLNPGTTYNIKVKVKDSASNESSEYQISATTSIEFASVISVSAGGFDYDRTTSANHYYYYYNYTDLAVVGKDGYVYYARVSNTSSNALADLSNVSFTKMTGISNVKQVEVMSMYYGMYFNGHSQGSVVQLVALKNDGTVWTSYATTANSSSVATLASNATWSQYTGISNVKHISADSQVSGWSAMASTEAQIIAVKNDGTLWGVNYGSGTNSTGSWSYPFSAIAPSTTWYQFTKITDVNSADVGFNSFTHAGNAYFSAQIVVVKNDATLWTATATTSGISSNVAKYTYVSSGATFSKITTASNVATAEIGGGGVGYQYSSSSRYGGAAMQLAYTDTSGNVYTTSITSAGAAIISTTATFTKMSNISNLRDISIDGYGYGYIISWSSSGLVHYRLDAMLMIGLTYDDKIVYASASRTGVKLNSFIVLEPTATFTNIGNLP